MFFFKKFIQLIGKFFKPKNYFYYLIKLYQKFISFLNLELTICKKINLNELKKNSKDIKDLKLLTFLNSGCLEICLNMLKSAEHVGIEKEKFYIACLDVHSYEELKARDYVNSFLYKDQNKSAYQNWSSDSKSGFRNVVKHKWNIINQIYQKYPNLIWVDTDIVFKSNPIRLLSGHKEILFQSDLPGSIICTGFMVFNKSKACQRLIKDCSDAGAEDDQIVMNRLALTKYRKSIALLPKEYFPNGNIYYRKGVKKEALIVHNNWILGLDAKIKKFKEEGLWFYNS